MATYSIIVACTKVGGIGKNGKLPWHIPEDLRHFADITTHTEKCDKLNAVVMGRRTWESLPSNKRPLPRRQNIVISSTMTCNDMHDDKETWICPDIPMALERITSSGNIDRVFVIGGSSLYEYAVHDPACTSAYISLVFDDERCDTHFPLDAFNKAFQLEKVQGTSKDGKCMFLEYKRVSI